MKDDYIKKSDALSVSLYLVLVIRSVTRSFKLFNNYRGNIMQCVRDSLMSNQQSAAKPRDIQFTIERREANPYLWEIATSEISCVF